jgi:hypothetical protein
MRGLFGTEMGLFEGGFVIFRVPVVICPHMSEVSGG